MFYNHQRLIILKHYAFKRNKTTRKNITRQVPTKIYHLSQIYTMSVEHNMSICQSKLYALSSLILNRRIKQQQFIFYLLEYTRRGFI